MRDRFSSMSKSNMGSSSRINPTSYCKTSVSVLLLLLLCFPLISSHKILNVNILAYYPFAQNLNDYSGNDYHGSAHGNPYFIDDRLDFEQSAINLDGEEDFLSFPIGKYPSIAVSVWLKPDIGTDSAIIFDYGQKKFYTEIDAITSATNPAYYVTVEFPGKVKFKSSSMLWFTEWHHLYVDSGNGMQGPRVFINGYLSKEVYNKFSLQAISDLIIVGRPSDSIIKKNKLYAGGIDDLRIYSNPLSGIEVLNEYVKNPIGISEKIKAKQFIYINNSKKVLKITGHELFVSGIEIYSISGELLYQSDFKQVIDLSSIAKGVLIVRLIDYDGILLYAEKHLNY